MAVHAVAVIGAGTMGSGIAQVAAVARLGVTLIEVSDAAIEQGLEGIRGNLQKLVAKGKMTEGTRRLHSDRSVERPRSRTWRPQML